MPEIQKLHEEYEAQEDSDVVILGIAAPDLGGEASGEEIKAFFGRKWIHVSSCDGYDRGDFLKLWNQCISDNFMIDKDGNVYGYVSGQLSEDVMRNIIEQTQKQGEHKNDK